MKVLTQEHYQTLLANGKAQQIAQQQGRTEDFYPVVKLFTPDASATWLLTEIIPDDPTLAFGLCDLGLGCPELGYVSMTELETVRGQLGLPVERDIAFKADKLLSKYAELAQLHQRIIA